MSPAVLRPCGRTRGRVALRPHDHPRRLKGATTTIAEHEKGYFTEASSAKVVIARNAAATDERLKQVMAVIIRHPHAAVKEIEPTQEEWMRAILFLTETGPMCTDWRQEFILLSNVLGLSMLVDAINNRKPSGATGTTVLGPFHVAGAPELPNGANIALDGNGEPMFVHGRVTGTAGNPIAGAKVDVWPANDEGFYNVQQKGIQPEFNLRGVFTTDAEGRYSFLGAKPRYYPIPDDGPVGRLLRALGRHPHRPAHLRYIASDAVFGVKESLMARFETVTDSARTAAAGTTAPFWEVRNDFVLVPA